MKPTDSPLSPPTGLSTEFADAIEEQIARIRESIQKEVGVPRPQIRGETETMWESRPTIWPSSTLTMTGSITSGRSWDYQKRLPFELERDGTSGTLLLNIPTSSRSRGFSRVWTFVRRAVSLLRRPPEPSVADDTNTQLETLSN